MSLSALRVTALGVLVAACAAPPPPESADVLGDALSAADFDTTVQQLSALPWLPWAFTTDGCYARAEYYSMLLATKGIPSNHLYAVAQPPTKLGGIWRWHVAPLVTKDGDPNHVYVLDPVYDRTKALTNVEWLAHQNWPDPSVPKYPRLHVQPGNSYLAQDDTSEPLVNPAEPSAADYKEPTFAEMPAFRMPSVRAACDTMHRYIDREPGTTAAEKTQKHASLGRETKRIVGELVAKGKVAGDPALPRSCTLEAIDADEETETATEPFVEPTRVP